MKVSYIKTCTLPQDLIPLLKTRGLLIPDEQKAVDYLTNIGYYRLSAYCYPLLRDPKTDHVYKEDNLENGFGDLRQSTYFCRAFFELFDTRGNMRIVSRFIIYLIRIYLPKTSHSPNNKW